MTMGRGFLMRIPAACGVLALLIGAGCGDDGGGDGGVDALPGADGSGGGGAAEDVASEDDAATPGDPDAATGDPELTALKQQVVTAIRSGSDAASFREPANKFARHTLRVSLRQWRAGPKLPGLSRWLEAFDKQEPAGEDGADAYGRG